MFFKTYIWGSRRSRPSAFVIAATILTRRRTHEVPDSDLHGRSHISLGEPLRGAEGCGLARVLRDPRGPGRDGRRAAPGGEHGHDGARPGRPHADHRRTFR